MPGSPSTRSRTSRSGRKSRRDSSSPTSPKGQRSMFDNISSFFGAGAATTPGRPSLSRRTSLSSRRSRNSRRASQDEDAVDLQSDEEERWGYSSGEEYDSPAEQSVFGDMPPSPSTGLPLLTGMGDPFFGDTRIEMGDVPLDVPTSTSGPPSRQAIYIQEEDIHLRLIGFEIVQWREWLWTVGSLLTVGTLGLAGHWSPMIRLRRIGKELPFNSLNHGAIVVEVGRLCVDDAWNNSRS